VLVISCGFTYYEVNGLNSTYGALPSQVNDAVGKLNTAVAGISGNITTAVNAAVSSYETRIHNLETQIAGYATSGQLGQSNTNIANLTSQITALQATINSANLTGMQPQITALQVLLNQIIDTNDLLHTKLTVDSVLPSAYFISDPSLYVPGTPATLTLGSAIITITLKVQNNSTANITLNDLKVNLDPSFSFGILPTGTIIQPVAYLTYGSGLHPLNWSAAYNAAFNGYALSGLSIPILTGKTALISFQYIVWFQYPNVVAPNTNVLMWASMQTQFMVNPTISIVSYDFS